MTNDKTIDYYIPVLEKFADLQSTHWIFNSIGFVVDINYFNGINDFEFIPEYSMSRTMVFTVLSRIADIDENDTRFYL